MPIHDYSCDKCGDTVELHRSMREIDEPVEHDDCGGSLVREEIAVIGSAHMAFEPGVVLKSGEVVKGTFGPPKQPPRRTAAKNMP